MTEKINAFKKQFNTEKRMPSHTEIRQALGGYKGPLTTDTNGNIIIGMDDGKDTTTLTDPKKQALLDLLTTLGW